MDAYIRPLTHKQAKTVAPELNLAEIRPETELYGLFKETGELVLLTDNRSATFFQANADGMTVKARH